MLNKRHRKSIVSTVLWPVLLIILVQSILFLCIFGFGDVSQTLKDRSITILEERTTNRANILQSELLNTWSSWETQAAAFEQAADSMLSGSNGSEERYLTNITDDLISLLRTSNADDIFLILDGMDGDQNKQGISFHITDNKTFMSDDSDITVDLARNELLDSLGLSASTTWMESLHLDPSAPANDFYYKPYNAATAYPNVSTDDLGYWSSTFRFPGKATPSFTYTKALRLSDGSVFGVLGVGVSTEHLEEFLQLSEQDPTRQGTYMLAQTDPDGESLTTILSSSSNPRYRANEYGITDTPESSSSLFELIPPDGYESDRILASIQPLQLYDQHSPFSGEQWVFASAVEEASLLYTTRYVVRINLMALLISLGFAILLAFVFGRSATKPIAELSQEIRTSDGSISEFKRTNITEIDGLVQSIETLYQNVASRAARFSQIIEAADVPIGTFEHDTRTNYVLITVPFFSLLGKKDLSPSAYYMPYNEFISSINELNNSRDSFEGDNTHIYKIIDEKGGPHWIRFKIIYAGVFQYGVVTDITEKTLERQRHEFERNYDILTNLLNRRAFYAQIQEKFQDPSALGIAALVIWDLDNLKYINDIYGHDYGDEYIRGAANIFKRFIPFNNAIVARMTGDEFYVFLYDYSKKEAIHDAINSVRQSMAASSVTLPDGLKTKIRATAGVAWYPDDAQDYQTLVKYADFAMYTAKSKEKGEITEFNKIIYNKDAFLLNSKEELYRIIDEQRVKYAFQPIVDAHTGKIFAYEALMRPDSKTLSSPLDVIRLAKSQSKLYQIERITSFESLRTFLHFDNIPADRKLFINTLPGQILSEQDLLRFERAFKDVLYRVVFEFTEIEELNEEYTDKKLSIINRWSSKIALDDYGAGYNSDTILLWLNPGYVKLDMSLIRNIDADESRQLFVQNMLIYMKKKKIKVIAEGVETREELCTLIDMGVDYLQGYYLGRPEFTPAGNTEREGEILQYRAFL